jgi:hypothetical protein
MFQKWFVCREVLQIHRRAADIGISYNIVLIVEDHSLICKYVLYDLVQMSLWQLMPREDAPNKKFEVRGKRRRHFVFFPEAM